MLIHLHSKKGHEAIYKLHALRLITMGGSLDPMPDGSTASVVDCLYSSMVPKILEADDGLTIIPKQGPVGKNIAALLSQYGVKETDTKRDVLAALHKAQPNHLFHPMLEDL